MEEADQLLRANVVHHGTGGYRDPYPLPAPALESARLLWRPVHTKVTVAFVLLLVAFVRLSA